MESPLFAKTEHGVIGSLDHPELFEDFKHTFLDFDKAVSAERINVIALLICQHFYGEKYNSIKKLKCDLSLLKINWSKIISDKESVAVSSKPINFRVIQRHLSKHMAFKHYELDLPEIISFWMDRSINAAMNFSYADATDELTLKDGLLKQQYGNSFPIDPQLNQEGLLITSFLQLVTKRIIYSRNYLVRESQNFFTSEWLFTLKDFLNHSISLVDISLNQLYLKAQYDKKESWKFNAGDLGPRHGVRLMNKLEWVYKITGNQLNIENERKALEKLKEVRNHLNHFDPPAFVVTVSEVCEWLNDIFQIADIVIKIRRCAGEPMNKELIELYLQPDTHFIPMKPRSKDLTSQNNGYDSVRYKK